MKDDMIGIDLGNGRIIRIIGGTDIIYLKCYDEEFEKIKQASIWGLADGIEINKKSGEEQYEH